MTNNQIRESEETVLQVIRANDLVFAKESPLSLAKEIQGLRAVFDEVPHIHTLASFPCHIQMGSGNEATPCDMNITCMLVKCGALHFHPRRAPRHHMLK